MLLSDFLSFIFLTITITATSVAAESTKQDLVERIASRRTKREAIVITGYQPHHFRLDAPIQRVSKLRYWQKKPKRGALKPFHGPPSSPNRVPVKKYRKKQLRSKYHKYSSKRNAKPRYPSSPSYYGRPVPRPPKPPRQQPYYSQEPAGFGEPPKEIAQEYVQPPKQSYGEPPVDSYGNPLSQSFHAGLPTIENSNSNLDHVQQYQSLQSYHQDANIDNNNAYSKHHPIYTHPEQDDAQEEAQKYNEYKFDSYADVYKQLPINEHHHQNVNKKNKHHNTPNLNINKPWKGKLKTNDQSHDHVVVGGQYAEPPGRLVPSYHQSLTKYQGQEVEQDSYVDPEIGSSVSISPYVNYKHSNMAFSPQNLNDAFSTFD